ncbi:MAG: ABC transporter substrate-binding protein [Lachnospiraceae bacterium]|nr:ABC transporter substrate-binding protein [Lachnospiraceae bacterium]
MRRKVLSIVTALVMAVALAGCSAGADNASKVYNIGVCQLVEHPALDAATQGFKEALIAKLGEDKVKFDVQNAQGEQATSATICNGFVSDNVDLILANATTPLQTAAAATSSIPILGTSVTDYASALQISGWNGTTGRNISGTSDLAPIDQQEKMLKELFPDVKKVGLLFCTAESNSAYQIDLFVKALEADGIAYVKYGVADSNEIQSVVTNAVSECDVLYIPTDNTLANATETIYNIVVPAGIPVIVGEEGICKGCGVATLSISYYDLGYTTGEMAYEILVNGKDIKTLEVKYAPNTTKKYNKSICEKLGITIPSDYTAIEE